MAIKNGGSTNYSIFGDASGIKEVPLSRRNRSLLCSHM
jgi:hypothetical protein